MVRLYNTFEFTGALNFTREPYRKKRFDSGWEKHEMSLIINESKQNGAFVKIDTGIHTAKENVVHTMLKQLFGEKTESKAKIAWEDRHNPDTVNMVQDFKKTIVDLTDPEVSKEEYFNTKREIYNLETKENATDNDKATLQSLYEKLPTLLPDRKEFIHAYDAVQFLNGKLESLKGKKVRVKGQISKSNYNGKFYTTYEPQSIELVSEETPNKLSARLDLFFTEGAVDESGFEEDKIINFDTYMLSYDGTDKRDKFFPVATVLNASKLDLTNPAHLGRVNFIKKVLDKKGKIVYHIPFDVKVFRGSEEVEFSEKDLTPMQREMVELGIATVESFAPKGGMLGESVEQVRLVKPLLEYFNETNDFREGVAETDFEVEDLVFIVDAKDDVPKQEIKKDEPKQEVEFSELDELL